jgi:hypothetical protein
MSSTRQTTDKGIFRQERFASSQEFERGLMANLVAKRCSVLSRAEDRELVWFIQLLSHQDGGLNKLAADLRVHFPERIATASMRQFGIKAGQVYSTRQVRAVRSEIPAGEFSYPLKGEMEEHNSMALLAIPDGPRDAVDNYFGNWKHERDRRVAEIDAESAKLPSSYRAESFIVCCRDEAEKELAKHLACLCLDPALPITDGKPWYFPTLISTLRQFQAEWIEKRKPVVVTTVGKEVCDALDYANENGRLILVDGLARIGKTFSAYAWCQQHPGRARYIQVPATNDDFSFFRAIARSLGVSITLKAKAQELRCRIEETLQSGSLMLVFDEAHYLWPQSHYRNTTPGRVNWLMTALTNNGVPVALITTPQFMRSQKEIELRTCWTGEQFTGRIGHYQKLPDALTTGDLESVARSFLPDSDARSIEMLVLYAQNSAKYLAGITAAVGRAQFIAKRAGRQRIELKDVKCAIKESVIPSDSAFAAAMKDIEKPSRRRAVSISAPPSQDECNHFERLVQPVNLERAQATPERFRAELVH